MDWMANDGDANEKQLWLLENVCAEYRTDQHVCYDIVQLARSNPELFGPVVHFEQELALIDSNLVQLIAQYETLCLPQLQPPAATSCSSLFDLDLAPETTTTTTTDHRQYFLFHDDDANADVAADGENFTELFRQLANHDNNHEQRLDDIDANTQSLFGNIDQQQHQHQQEHQPPIKQQRSQDGNSSNTKKKRKNNNDGGGSTTGAAAAAGNHQNRIWYKCGWEGCSFGSFYSGVVKRHGHQLHGGTIKIDKCSAANETNGTTDGNGTVHHRFKCHWPGCDVSLVAFHKLVEHNRKHTGEKPFRCKWKSCNYATARLYSIIIHERTHKLDSATTSSASSSSSSASSSFYQ